MYWHDTNGPFNRQTSSKLVNMGAALRKGEFSKFQYGSKKTVKSQDFVVNGHRSFQILFVVKPSLTEPQIRFSVVALWTPVALLEQQSFSLEDRFSQLGGFEHEGTALSSSVSRVSPHFTRGAVKLNISLPTLPIRGADPDVPETWKCCFRANFSEQTLRLSKELVFQN